MDVRIEPATASDAPAILALQRLAYQSEARLYDNWAIPPLQQTLDELIAEFVSGQPLKALLGNEIVGSVRGKLVDATCHVGRLIVHPDVQCRGIGSRLMREIEQAFPEANRFQLFTGSRSASNIRLYELLGYKQFRLQELSADLALVYMEKWKCASVRG